MLNRQVNAPVVSHTDEQKATVTAAITKYVHGRSRNWSRSKKTKANVTQRWGVVTKYICQKRSPSCASPSAHQPTSAKTGHSKLATKKRSSHGPNSHRPNNFPLLPRALAARS